MRYEHGHIVRGNRLLPYDRPQEKRELERMVNEEFEQSQLYRPPVQDRPFESPIW